MKRRVTFVQKANDAFNQDQITVTESSIVIQGLQSVREDRFTFGYDELPAEVFLPFLSTNSGFKYLDHVACSWFETIL